MSQHIEFSPEDMKALTNGITNDTDPWVLLFLALMLFNKDSSVDQDIISRISNLEGRMSIVEKLITK